MKVSPAFSKAAGCRGGALARAPQSAELSFCSNKRRRGSKGEPSPGVPPFIFRLCVCAGGLGGGRYPVLPFDPISLVLAQRNGVEPPKKGAFLPWRLHYPRERCRSVDGTFLARLGAGLVRVGGGCGCFAWSVYCAGVTVASRFRLLPKRVSLGLHPVSLRKSKEMGWNGQQGAAAFAQRSGAHVTAQNDGEAFIRNSGRGWLGRRAYPPGAGRRPRRFRR